MSSWTTGWQVSRCHSLQMALRISLFCPLKEPQEQSRWWEQMASGYLCGPGAVPCAPAMTPAPLCSASRHCAMGSRPRGGTAQIRVRLQTPRSRTLPAPHVQSSCLVLSLLLSAVCRHVLGHLLTLFACLRVRRQSIPECAAGWRDGRAATLPPPAKPGQQSVSRQSWSVTHSS